MGSQMRGRRPRGVLSRATHERPTNRERSNDHHGPRRVLAALGLSPREAQVLAWVAEGKTNGEIGIILGARPRTVAKHLERIFRKLGVETRTAAAASALSLSAS